MSERASRATAAAGSRGGRPRIVLLEIARFGKGRVTVPVKGS